MNLQRRLKEISKKFQHGKVTIIGDVILDKYITGKVERISPEAPVPVMEIGKEELKLGGAGNVSANVKSLGGNVSLYSVIGEDSEGKEIEKLLDLWGISSEGIIKDSSRITTLKTRVIAHNQQLVRLDREKRIPLRDEIVDRMFTSLKNPQEKSVIIISDYSKGVITPYLLSLIKKIFVNSIVLVDPQVKHSSLYKGFYLITPNLKEAISILKEEEKPEKLARRLKDKIKIDNVLITLGEDGMLLYENNKFLKIPSLAREVYDVTGAGDTVVAVLGLSLSVGASLKESTLLSNLAAGIVVGKFGTSQVTVDELEEAIKKYKNEIRDYF